MIVDEGLINNWRSSFFSPANPVKISSLKKADGGVLYCLEITKNYHDSQSLTVDQVNHHHHLIITIVFFTRKNYTNTSYLS